jgi:hypothetical protein
LFLLNLLSFFCSRRSFAPCLPVASLARLVLLLLVLLGVLVVLGSPTNFFLASFARSVFLLARFARSDFLVLVVVVAVLLGEGKKKHPRSLCSRFARSDFVLLMLAVAVVVGEETTSERSEREETNVSGPSRHERP